MVIEVCRAVIDITDYQEKINFTLYSSAHVPKVTGLLCNTITKSQTISHKLDSDQIIWGTSRHKSIDHSPGILSIAQTYPNCKRQSKDQASTKH